MMITEKTYITKWVLYLFFLFLLAVPASVSYAQDVDDEGEMFWGDEEEDDVEEQDGSEAIDGDAAAPAAPSSSSMPAVPRPRALVVVATIAPVRTGSALRQPEPVRRAAPPHPPPLGADAGAGGDVAEQVVARAAEDAA